jgi:hypothetical protein
MAILASRRKEPAMAEAALGQIAVAAEAMRWGGDEHAAYYSARLSEARTLLNWLKTH